MLSVLMVGSAAVAQVDRAELGRIDSEIAVLETAHKQVMGELAMLEKALSSPDTVIWPTADGWSSATSTDLIKKVAFLQMAAARPEAKDRVDRISGLGLPASLVEMVEGRPDRPQQIVRNWSSGQGAAAQKAISTHHQRLKRTARMTESWLAESRSRRQATMQPTTQPAAFSQGPCHVPPGRWAVGSTREELEIESSAYFVTATKTKGSRNVPAGKINFYVHPRTCDAGLQTAEEGFVNPYWIRSRIEVEWITPGEQFSIQWPERAAVVYTLVK